MEKLPWIEPSHIHFAEWQVRKRSAERLVAFLYNKGRPLNILEAGCGNGWLCSMLADIPGSTVTGIDINTSELYQARRVFATKTNLFFAEGDPVTAALENRFDTVIFAASLQYFPSIHEIIDKALSLLQQHGEIHIVDTHFYETGGQALAARQRSAHYYKSLGCPEMSLFYHHHVYDSLSPFKYKFLFDPRLWRNRFFGTKDPFPWICITRE